MLTPHFISQDKTFILYKGDCLSIIPSLTNKFDLVFADPPYFLSSNGNTIHSGQIVSVNKGNWDKSKKFAEALSFNYNWLKAVKDKLRDNGTIWVSGTRHNIFTIIQAMEELNYKILNVITWEKTNPPPNFNIKIFKQSTEFIVFARKSEKYTHKFNYELLKKINGGKRMSDVWKLPSIGKWEKSCGKHPTQKPINILARIILASTDEQDLILDPFAGSSTTGIAANLLGRKFIGIDTEKKYLEISKKRKIEIEDFRLFIRYKSNLKNLIKLNDLKLFLDMP